jgi:hypothetical protein
MSKRLPIYIPHLSNEGKVEGKKSSSTSGGKRVPDYVPHQSTLSVQDVIDYSTPQGAAMANEEMRRLRMAVSEVKQIVPAAATETPQQIVTTTTSTPSTPAEPQKEWFEEITSNDGSVVIVHNHTGHLHDLSVWNYQTQWEYIYLSTLGTFLNLPCNREDTAIIPGTPHNQSGWIPMRCDNEVLTDDEDWVSFARQAQNITLPNPIDPLNSPPPPGADNLKRPHFVFKPTRAGDYHISATVEIEIDHTRAALNWEHIPDGILVVERCKYAKFANTTSFPYYQPSCTVDSLGGWAAQDYYWSILDMKIRAYADRFIAAYGGFGGDNYAAQSAGHFVNKIMLHGEDQVYMNGVDDCLIFWYKFDYIHLFLTPPYTYTYQRFNVADVTRLWENIDIHWRGNRGVQTASSALPPPAGRSLKQIIENYNQEDTL